MLPTHTFLIVPTMTRCKKNVFRYVRVVILVCCTSVAGACSSLITILDAHDPDNPQALASSTALPRWDPDPDEPERCGCQRSQTSNRGSVVVREADGFVPCGQFRPIDTRRDPVQLADFRIDVVDPDGVGVRPGSVATRDNSVCRPQRSGKRDRNRNRPR